MSRVDDFERLLDDLLEAGVFEPSEGGELRPTETYRREQETYRMEVEGYDEDEFDATLRRFATAEDLDPAEVGTRTLGDALAIYHVAEPVDRERSLLAALALDRIGASEREPGVPDGFVALDGEDVDGFRRNHPASVVFFWREDCDPCEGARESFEALLADDVIPEAVGLGAVYGPDSADLLREEYQVAVAPTTLFCVGGRIDSRIVGNPGYEAFRAEIETIWESAR